MSNDTDDGRPRIVNLNGNAITSEAQKGIDRQKIIDAAISVSLCLDQMARQQVGAPKSIRYNIAAGSVTIRVLHEELAKAKEEIKSLKQTYEPSL
jgi:hypothetical protein